MDKRAYVCTYCDADVPHSETRVRDGALCCKNCRFGPAGTDDTHAVEALTHRPHG